MSVEDDLKLLANRVRALESAVASLEGMAAASHGQEHKLSAGGSSIVVNAQGIRIESSGHVLINAKGTLLADAMGRVELRTPGPMSLSSQGSFFIGTPIQLTVNAGTKWELTAKEGKMQFGSGLRTHVTGTFSQTIGGAMETTVGLMSDTTIGGLSRTRILGQCATWIAGESSTQVGGSQTTMVGHSCSTTAGADYKLVTKRDFSVTTPDLDLMADRRHGVTIKSDHSVKALAGDAALVMKRDGAVNLNGKDLHMVGSGKIDIVASGEMTLKGMKILQN